LLSTGVMLADLLAGLLEEIPADAFPGEDPADVLRDMLTGTLRPVAEAAGAGPVRQATSLLGAVADRTISDLRAAVERASED
jgi:hypothetical protein